MSFALGVAMLVASTARAEPSAADKETARRLMSDGRSKRDAGDLRGALEAFKAADALMDVPTTSLEVARTEIAMGQLVEAHEKLLAIDRIEAAPNEPKPFAEARVAAQSLANEVEARIPTLKIVIVGAAPDAAFRVSVDGAEVPAASLVAPRAVDPGHHVVTASVPGRGPTTVELDVAERDTKEVSLDLSAPTDEPSPAAHPATEPAPESSAPSRRLPMLAWVGFGVGAAGLVTGSVTGLLAISSFNSAKSKGCVGNRCPPASYGELDTANTMATVSTVSFVIAGLGAGLGVASIFLVPSSPPEPSAGTASVRVRPWIGAGSAGLVGTF
jgi:hypothetical protein